MGKAVVRRATVEDIHVVSLLWLLMVGDLAPDLTPRVDWWRQIAADLLASGNYYLYLAEVEGTAVGFIDGIVYPEPATGMLHGVCQHFYVLPEFRGTDVAPQLYRVLRRDGKARSVDLLEIFCFPGQSEYWREHGFVPKRYLMRRGYV